MMFQRILVPLDGSPQSERVIPVALRLAKANHGTIILLHVISSIWPSFSPSRHIQRPTLRTKTEAEHYLSSLLERKPFQTLQDITTEVIVEQGDEGATIVDISHQLHADIIMISTHNDTGHARGSIGHVIDKVTKDADIPVLLIPEEGALPLGPHPDPIVPLRILVPLDGSNHAMSALEPSANLVAALCVSQMCALHLLHVIDNVQSLQPAQYYLQTITARLKRGEIAPIVAERHMTVTWSIAVTSDIADAIIQLAENRLGADDSVPGGCDIITMPTHGLTGYSLWTLGSTTSRVRAESSIPLLIIRQTVAKTEESQEKYNLYEPEVPLDRA